MYYAFLDESLKSNKLFTSSVVVPQGRYNDAVKLAKFQSVKNRLEEIDKFLERVSGLAVICQLDLDKKWLTQKNEDSCTDIRRMSRRDNVWSWAITYALEFGMIELEKKGHIISTVDVFHDPKTLTDDHKKALHSLMKKDLINIFRRGLRPSGKAKGLWKTSIRRIESVPKASRDKPDKFQRGVWLADQIVRCVKATTHEKVTRNVSLRNITQYILNTVERWEKGDLI